MDNWFPEFTRSTLRRPPMELVANILWSLLKERNKRLFKPCEPDLVTVLEQAEKLDTDFKRWNFEAQIRATKQGTLLKMWLLLTKG